MKKAIYIISLALIATILASCSTNNPQEFPKTPYTSGNVSLTLKKGVTTKEQVIQAFGSPNIVTQNADGDSVWTYQTNATIQNSSKKEGFLTLILVGGATKNSDFMESQKTMTIIITFKDDVVSNFKSLSTSF
ncbi:11.6 kDa putative exported protein [Francisella sp. W12-1067]|nr:11.6 kDa putative exported protein [Francisella sp. W12-1067]